MQVKKGNIYGNSKCINTMNLSVTFNQQCQATHAYPWSCAEDLGSFIIRSNQSVSATVYLKFGAEIAELRTRPPPACSILCVSHFHGEMVNRCTYCPSAQAATSALYIKALNRVLRATEKSRLSIATGKGGS